MIEGLGLSPELISDALKVIHSVLLIAPQKSGLSARGTSEFFPEYHWMFSAQITSVHGARLGRYVMVDVQGTVKTPASSTVKWSCSTLPRCLGSISTTPVAA